MLPKTHIGIVSNTGWNIYNFRLNVVKYMIKLGYQVYVICPFDHYVSHFKNINGLHYIPLKHLNRGGVNPIQDIQLIFELKRIYNECNLDLVIHYTHKPNIFGGIAASISKTKSIACITGLGYSFIHSGIIKNITKLLYKISSKFHRHFIFENKDDQQLFIDSKFTSRTQSTAIKGCGVDSRYYKPRMNVAIEYDFIFIGRLLKDKGILEFLASSEAILCDNIPIKCLIIGSIDDKNPASMSREELISWKNKNLFSFINAENDVRPYIAKSKCLVLPSYREGMPRSVLEAMSMSKAIITTDTAGCRETVPNQENGILIPIRNKLALVSAMKTILEMDEERLHSLGEKSRSLVLELFDSSIIAEQIVTIAQSIIDEK